MNDAVANSPAPELAAPKPTGWTPARWCKVIALIFAAHIALIFLLSEKPPVARVVANVPALTLVKGSSEMLALDDPTLFALPHPQDFTAAWLKLPPVKTPSFRWTEPPRPLPFSIDNLGAALSRFMQTNYFSVEQPDFKPVPELSAPPLPVEPALAQNSTMRVQGELAHRLLPAPIYLTNWPYADVLAPGVVQVLVAASGNVISTVLLTSSGYDAADQRALEIARSLRFTPSPYLTFGRINFNWHTVAPAASP